MKKNTLLICVATMVMAFHGATAAETGEVRRLVQEMLRKPNSFTPSLFALIDIGYDAFPTIYEIIEEGINKEDQLLIFTLFSMIDGDNLASEGEEKALEWVRMVLESDNSGIAGYLVQKSTDAKDVELIQQWCGSGHTGFLETRLAGTNIFKWSDPYIYANESTMRLYPSAANTGPQAVYVREILLRYWEQSEGHHSPPIPSELLTMVVSFDATGNPMCNVDLAKYGLSMPVIDPKPDKYYRGEYTVTFPHDADASAPTPPPQDIAITPTPDIADGEDTAQSQDTIGSPVTESRNPTAKSPWLYIAIPALAAILGVAVWRLSHHKS